MPVTLKAFVPRCCARVRISHPSHYIYSPVNLELWKQGAKVIFESVTHELLKMASTTIQSNVTKDSTGVIVIVFYSFVCRLGGMLSFWSKTIHKHKQHITQLHLINHCEKEKNEPNVSGLLPKFHSSTFFLSKRLVGSWA